MTSSDVEMWRGALEEIGTRIAGRFRRREVRERVTGYLTALLDRVERKNGWQLAEHLGERGPRNVQRVLVGSQWDADAVRDDLRSVVIEHLGAPDGVLIVDETGFLKKGAKSAGVQRQSPTGYPGTAGKRENCQLGVFLVYGSVRGRAFLDRALYLPESWLANQARCQEAGVPEGTEFATKPVLAQRMLERALGADVPAAWILGDEVYGNDEPLRRWLEARGQAFVFAVSSTHPLWQDMTQRPTAAIVAELAADAWSTVSAARAVARRSGPPPRRRTRSMICHCSTSRDHAWACSGEDICVYAPQGTESPSSINDNNHMTENDAKEEDRE